MYLAKCVSNALNTVMDDSMRKPVHTMLGEVIQLWVRDRAVPVHYYGNLLYRKDLDDSIYAYVGWKNIRELYAQINDPLWTPVFDNKVMFDLFFRQRDVNLPRSVGFNAENQFTIGKDVVRVSNRQQLLDVLELLVSSSPNGSIFAKPIDGTQGRGCFAFDWSDVARICDNEGSRLMKGHYLYQEVIAQHPKMAQLNPSSVNTLRIDTYRTAEGEVSVMSALLRMGANSKCIDNASSGGCFVGVDLEQGLLMRKGFRLPKYNPNILERHPDSGVIFKGFEIPFFCEAVMLAKRVAEMIPMSVVGWDLAIGCEGPVLIEGDPTYSPRMSEMAYGGYWRNPVFRRLVEDHSPRMMRIGSRFDETDLG